MKKLFYFLALIPILTFSQSWKYQSGGNAFDGKYKTSYVNGVGVEFPYKTPLLAINKFDKNGSINFFISGAGYFQRGTNVGVQWVFNTEPNVIYSAYNFSYSNDGKTLFFELFTDPKSNIKLSKFEFINKLKSANKVSVRISNKFGSNDLTFSLRGSTKAINFVLPKEFMDKKVKEIIKLRKEEENVESLSIIIFNRLIESAKSQGLDKSSLSSLEGKIKKDLGITDGYKSKRPINEYLSITLDFLTKRVNQYSGVHVYYVLKGGVKEEISGYFTLVKHAPILERIKKENEEKAIKLKKKEEEESLKIKKRKKAKDRIISEILKKYEGVELKESILKNISKIEEYPFTEWKLSDIIGVTLKINSYSDGVLLIKFKERKDYVTTIFFEGGFLNKKYLRKYKMKLGGTY